MRSNVPPLVAGDPDSSPAYPSSDPYWWRSLPDFDPAIARVGGRAAGSLPPRLRVVKELERLALLANESLDDIRHKLLTYKAGDLWLPAGGIPKEETDIPPVITILLVGFAGSGKSSLINLMYSVLGHAGFIPFAQTTSPAGNERRTACLEEHNVLRSMRNGFCVFDSRGLDYSRVDEGLEEVGEWMEDGVRHCQPCRGSGTPGTSTSSSSSSSASSFPYSSSSSRSNAAAVVAAKRFARRRVNCPFVVADLSELHHSLQAGDLRLLEATRDLFNSPVIKTTCTDNPILVLTHGDELSAEERIMGRVRVCEYLGLSETSGVYDVACSNEYGAAVEEMDPVTSYAVAEAVYRALVVADRSHPPRPSVKDWVFLALAWAMCALSSLFAFLSSCCSKLAKANREHTKLRLH